MSASVIRLRSVCKRMVTHDPRYARHARRNVQLFDGRVVRQGPRELVEQAS